VTHHIVRNAIAKILPLSAKIDHQQIFSLYVYTFNVVIIVTRKCKWKWKFKMVRTN
jgi:hypothetical protein